MVTANFKSQSLQLPFQSKRWAPRLTVLPSPPVVNSGGLGNTRIEPECCTIYENCFHLNVCLFFSFNTFSFFRCLRILRIAQTQPVRWWTSLGMCYSLQTMLPDYLWQKWDEEHQTNQQVGKLICEVRMRWVGVEWDGTRWDGMGVVGTGVVISIFI